MATPAVALASAVFTATNGCIGSFNIVGTWVVKLVNFAEACGEAKDRIQVLQSEVDFCRINLDLWQKKWKLDRTTTTRWQKELWGEKTLLICMKVTRIQDKCNMFKKEFEKFFQPQMSTYLDNAISNGRTISQDRALSDYRSDGEQDVSIKKIIEFTRRLDTLGTKWVKEMQAWLEELFETADTAFLDKRGEKVSGRLTDAQLQVIRSSTLMQMAFELRNASEGLYQSLDAAVTAQATNRSTKLKIDLTGARDGFLLETVQSQTAAQLIYHLFLQWDGSPKEVCVEGPIDVEELQGAADFLSAYCQIPRQSDILIDDEPESKIFRSRTPREEERLVKSHDITIEDSQWVPTSLAEFLVGLEHLEIQNCNRIFPLLERINLAFKVVESAVLLAGTSWLSSMGSDSLRLSQPSQGRGSYYNYTIDLDKPAQRTWKSFQQLASHIFRVGVVLVEIGYGRRVSDFDYNQWGILQFWFDGGEEYVPLGIVKKEITSNIDSKYASITAFCLDEIPVQCSKVAHLEGENFGDAYKSILEDYFGNVYLP
jgi:hypothetical protein